ncbi:pentatricopeptide repeat-containing protein [Arabidopsis lyrata subsp. lyrata]|uniref:Pentatricopeptide repeat-containing protein n=1 Tax=Arabidopsis lyrata subsp. lyrata TaxID=81972 RepID=D7M2R8_ARALL|nr:pentatricopeptide repeat-containing protein [Arabidopsis lyrata subsp. lyrata]
MTKSVPLSFVQSCIGHRGAAKLFHSRLYKNGLEKDVYLCNNLINAYLETGDSVSARKVFDEMPLRNCVSWACVVSGYSRNGEHKEALVFLRDMVKEGVFSNHYAFVSALRACQELDSVGILFGRQIHGLLFKLSYAVDAVVSNVLISMYWKCGGSLGYALRAFDDVQVKNSVSWNSIISVYSQTGDQRFAFKMFYSMQCDGSRPTEYTFGSLVTTACSLTEPDVRLLEQIMCTIQKSGFLTDLFVGSGLVSAFAKSGSLIHARKIFNQMETRNAVTLNGLMVGLVRQKWGEEATKLFMDMNSMIDVSPESYVILLSSFPEYSLAEEVGLKKGREVHGHVITTGLVDFMVGIGNGLVNMYAKCGSIADARRVFCFMTEKDSVSWNSMITGLDQNSCFIEAVERYQSMRRHEILPGSFTLISSISSCASLKWAKLGQQIHGESLKLGIDLNVSVSNALMTLYAETGCLNECRKIFSSMPEHDQVSWNSIIGALASSERSLPEAVACFLNALRAGQKLNRITFSSVLSAVSSLSFGELGKQIHGLALKYNIADEATTENALIACYGKCGEMDGCEKIFSRMSERRDDVTWNSMISGYIHNELLAKALDLVWFMMQTGQRLDSFMYATVLSAFASVATLERGMEVHACSVRACLESDVVVGSALVDMYSKCGRLDYALRFFNTMPLFANMKLDGQTPPDHVTFVGVLSACSHAGLLEEGFKHFESMSDSYGLAPRIEHFSCMADLLGRAGELDKLEDFIEKMPMKPNVLIWRTVLGACCRANGRKAELGKKAAEMLFQLEPENAVNYVLLGNMYAAGGRWEDLVKARKKMKDADVKKEAGYSWVTMKDGVHMFVAGDKSHPDADVIYKKLKELNRKMRDAGYVPQTGFALYDLEQENKEEILSYHSEKLAVAFVLAAQRSSTLPIRIMKNLRVCGDCHSAFKHISKIEGRQIILRDSNRFHHFQDGECSCSDFW